MSIEVIYFFVILYILCYIINIVYNIAFCCLISNIQLRTNTMGVKCRLFVDSTDKVKLFYIEDISDINVE
jgi:hypothetical protein